MASFWETPFLQSPLKIFLTVLLVILFIVVVVLIYRAQQALAKNEPLLIDEPASPVGYGSISAAKAPLSVSGREYTYNMWINVRDWDQGYNRYKCVLHRSATGPISKDYDMQAPANPSVWLYPRENKLMVRVSTLQDDVNSGYDRNIYPNYPTKLANGGQYTIVNPYFLSRGSNLERSDYESTTYICDISNIPLQRWVQITVVMWNRTLDVYINGKLVRSCVLPGVPAHVNAPIHVGAAEASNTFNGYVSRLKYINRACTAAEIYQMYLAGPLSTNFWWQNLQARAKVVLNIEG